MEENLRKKIVFTKTAANDLKSIQKFIHKDNKEAAKKVVETIINKIENTIAINPACGRAGRVLRTRELVITNYPYIVPYQVKNDTVLILRILHTSRKW